MNVPRARVILLLVFLGFLVLSAGVVIYAYSSRAIADKDLNTLLTRVLSIYAVHLAIILGGIFGQQDMEKNKLMRLPFWVAMALSITWNVLLTWRLILFGLAAHDPSRDDSVNAVLDYLTNISTASSFLVAGALSYFFTKQGVKQKGSS